MKQLRDSLSSGDTNGSNMKNSTNLSISPELYDTGFVKVDDEVDINMFPMFEKAVKSSVSFRGQRPGLTEVAIKNRESNRFVEEALVDNWMDMGLSSKQKVQKQSVSM